MRNSTLKNSAPIEREAPREQGASGNRSASFPTGLSDTNHIHECLSTGSGQ